MPPDDVQKPRILVVDDEPAIRRMVGKRLEVAGYEVIFASDGLEALNEARSQEPNLILLDLMLPKLNGYEVCRMLKFDKKYKTIPIVLLTARAAVSDELMGKACGANAFLRKPFDSKIMLSRIEELLKSSQTQSQ